MLVSEKLLSEFLKSLGNTTEQIRRNLAMRGIKGVMRDPERDPIAIAISQWFGCKCEVACPESILVYSKNEEEDGIFLQPPPDVINEFSSEFDKGKYPELIDTFETGIRLFKEMNAQLKRELNIN